jgi:NAD(P)-dependent dehydrogenase (short-subunit alcohol dehydrogenase family)
VALELAGQTLLVIGGSSGIGLETARSARQEGADLILTARNADSISRAGLELRARIAAFDATDLDRLNRFFDELPAPIDHVLVTAPVNGQLLLPLEVARNAPSKIRPGGTLLFTGCADDDRPGAGLSELTKTLAREIAPVRVNLIVPDFVDTTRPADVAAVALHLITNTAVTGGTFEIEERSTAPKTPRSV